MAGYLRTDTIFILRPWAEKGIELSTLAINIFTLHIFEDYINEAVHLRLLKQLINHFQDGLSPNVHLLKSDGFAPP